MKRYVYTLLFCVITPLLNAEEGGSGNVQGYHDSEFSIYGGFGLSTLSYKPTIGTVNTGLSAHIGAGYRIGFSPYSSMWSLRIDTKLSHYATAFNLNTLYTYSSATDPTGDAFEFRNTLTNHSEKQSAILLQIPLMVQFQTDHYRMVEYYMAIGGKIGIPLFGTYKTSIETLKNTGYFVEDNADLDVPLFLGFGTFNDVEKKGSLEFNTAFFASAETGAKISLNSVNLYVGVFLDYGLNTICPKSEQTFIEYNTDNPKDFIINSITQSTHHQTHPFVEKITPLSAGVRVRLAF